MEITHGEKQTEASSERPAHERVHGSVTNVGKGDAGRDEIVTTTTVHNGIIDSSGAALCRVQGGECGWGEVGVIYAPIPSKPAYWAGSDGSIWRYRRESYSKRRLAVSALGYHFVSFYGGHSSTVHRLILEAFIGKCPPGMQGCHNDGNPSNNAIDNLRWDTPKSNMADKKLHGTNREGSSNGKAVIDEATAIDIAKRLMSGERTVDIAKKLGVDRRIVDSIKRGSTWSHATGVPKRGR